MHGSEVIVQQFDVAARDLDRRWTVAEDPLEAEDVATVHQEGSGERVAQDVRRTAGLQFRASCEAVHELIQTSRRQSLSARPAEKRIVGPDTAAMSQPDSECLARSSTNGNDSLSATLPEHAASTFGEVDISDMKPGCLADTNAGIQQQQDDCSITLRIAGALAGSEQGDDLRVAKARDQLFGDTRKWHRSERVRGQVKLARHPRAEGLEGPYPASETARREGARPRLERKQPTANHRSLEVARRGCPPIPLDESDKLKQVVAIPINRARTTTGDLERHEVFVDQVPQTDLAKIRRRRDGYGSHVCSPR